MVIRKEALLLIDLTHGLVSIYERSLSVVSRGESEWVAVKEGLIPIEDDFRNQFFRVCTLADQYDTLIPVREEMKKWIIHLNTHYSRSSKKSSKTRFLSLKDATRLAEDTNSWLSSIRTVFSNRNTVLIKEENMEKIFPSHLRSALDPLTQADINDGLAAILNLIPTPAAMILLRAAENVVRNYYTKVTGNLQQGRNGDR